MRLFKKQPFESFAKFSVSFQDVTSFGKNLKKLNANFGKILRKEKILKNFCKLKKKTDENSDRTLEIFCDFEKILPFFYSYVYIFCLF